MAQINKEIECCGINEIDGIDDDPKDILEEVCYEYFDREHRCAFYFFSDIQDKKNGIQLKNFILKNNLGKITPSPTRINPNSSNSLRMWIWAINKKNLRAYWNEIHKKQYKENRPVNNSYYYNN